MVYNGNNSIENLKYDITRKSLFYDNLNMGPKGNKYYLTTCNFIGIYVCVTL